MTIKRVCLFSLLWMSLTACGGDGVERNVSCGNSAPGYCEVPILALFSRDAPVYSGLKVVSAGFVSMDRGRIVIVPTEEFASYHFRRNSVLVNFSDGVTEARARTYVGSYVVFEGYFSEDPDQLYWGVLNATDSFDPAPPSGADAAIGRPPRQ